MKKPCLSLPLDFEQREDVRTLTRLFRARAGGDDPAGLAVLCLLRIWLDWGRVGVVWRPLQQARLAGGRDWSEENLAHLLVECCGFPGEPQPFMEWLVEAGVVAILSRGDLDGLVLLGFAEANPHLLPGHESIQSKGARIMHEKRRAEEVAQLAAQQARVLEQAGLNLFPESAAATPEETQKCIAMVMTFDGLCGRALRTSPDYVADEGLMRDALHVLRGHAWADIVLVQRHVRAERDNPAMVKDTAAILRGFDAFLGKAKQ